MCYVDTYLSGLILVNFLQVITCLPAEIKIGSITPRDMKTFEDNLGGFPSQEYSIITWKFTIKRFNYTQNSPDIYLYFRHIGQLSFSEERDCVSFAGGYSISSYDPRWLHLSHTEDVYQDKRCSVHGSTLICEGELNIAIGFDAKFYVAAVYECQCKDRPYLNLWYNLTIIPYTEVPCRSLSTDLKDVSPVLAREQLEECVDSYPMYSRWNPQGYTIRQVALSYATFLRFLKVSMECYKYTMELTCRTRLPECTDGKVQIPCRDMCDDLNTGCAEVFKKLGFALSCNSHASKGESDICTYLPVECLGDPIPPEYGFISNNFNRVVGSRASYKCIDGFALHGDRSAFCAYSGEWHTVDAAECRNITSNSVSVSFAVSFSTATLVLAVVALVLFYFRFECRILAHRYCSCFYTLKRTVQKRKYHAFIACDEDRELEITIQRKLHHPLERLGYRLFADYSDYLVNVPPVRYIPEAIAESHRVIVILNQQFLDSSWCQYTLEQSFLQQIESEMLRVIIVLMQDKTSLKDVPRFLQSFLRTRYYVHINDPLFLTKLRYELPDPLDPDLVECGGLHVL